MLKKCQCCGKEFNAKKKSRIYCSMDCQWESMRKKEICYCLICGKEFYKGRETKGMYCSNECQWESMRVPKEVREARRIERYKKKLNNLQQRLLRAYEDIQNRKRICLTCSKEFIQYRGVGFCSDKCRKEANKKRIKEYRKKNHIDKDKRLSRNGKPDKSITLQKLYDRDKGVCQLCGNHTDFTDYIIDDKGNFIVGYSYPSIDHIQPISKGRSSSMGQCSACLYDM